MKKFSVDNDISMAKTIHKDFYTDQLVYEMSKEKIFSTALHYAGDIEMLPEKGSAFPLILLEGYLDEPLVIVRNKEDQVVCMSNVCTHRGNLLLTEPGKVSQLRCKYHGKTFSLNGDMIFMPEFKEVQNFPCQEDHLPSLQVFQWGNLLFIAMQHHLKPETYFGDMMKRMSFFPMDKLVRRDDLSKDYMVNANWALYCENYLEGFHIPFVHAGLCEVLDFGDYETELYYPYSSLQLGVAKGKENTFDLPPDSPDYGRNIAAYYFWVFPHMMFNFYPWGLSLNIVQPQAIDRTKVSFITYMYDESRYDTGAGKNLDKVEMEDEEIVHNVQKGVRSRFYTHGRYSVTREKGTHHFHTLLADFIGC